MLVAGTAIPVLPCHLSGSFDATPPDASTVRPRKIILQIGAPLTFEIADNHAEGWRRIAALSAKKSLRCPPANGHRKNTAPGIGAENWC